MSYACRVVAHSVNHAGDELVTAELTIPRCVLAELNTHRAASRNTSSSRAVPTGRLLAAVTEEPFVPEWTRAARGMVAAGPLGPAESERATAVCLRLRDAAVEAVRELAEIGVAKQDANRYLEPWMYVTVIMTVGRPGLRWFLALRDAPDADPKFSRAARMLRAAVDASEPRVLADGEWHTPYATFDDEVAVEALGGTPVDLGALGLSALAGLRVGSTGSAVERLAGFVTGGAGPAWREYLLASVSAARCARVSYLRQAEVRGPEAEFARTVELVRAGHWSPTEHQAVADSGARSPRGNLGPGFQQFRHLIGDGYDDAR